ncbi:MAG: dehydrogenase, partial [Clostridia bacterium]|nr:dehydrogenase [Clostridia bacterium]
CGAVYEALSFANMNQFNSLWEKGKGLPVLFAVSDNLYARGSNTKLETSGTQNLARLGNGLSDTAMYAESVNGLNPLAVADAVKRKKQGIISGKGATLLSFTTYRHGEHGIGDNKGSRPDSEVEAWKSLDPLITYADALINEGLITPDEKQSIITEVYSRVEKAYKLAIDLNVSPAHSFQTDPEFASKHLFNNGVIKGQKTSYDFSKLISEVTTYRDGIAKAVAEAYSNDPTLIAYGEDMRGWNSNSAVYKGFEKVLPYSKLFNTSISESAIVGSAVGYAMRGGSAVTELLYADFMTRAADEIINQLAKWQSLSGGTISLPVTLRLPIGRSYGGQHSQDFSGLIARVNGLKVFYPVTPNDAYQTLKHTLASTDPCVIFEPKEFYGVTELFNVTDSYVPTSVKATGDSATVVTIGACRYDAYSLHEELTAKGKGFDLISLISLNPMDLTPVIASIKKSGKCIIVCDGPSCGSFATDVVACLYKECFHELKAPIEIVGTDNSLIPPDATECGYYDYKAKLRHII